jgi:protein TonB
MDYAQQQRNPARHLSGITFVVLLHVLLVYALVNGLARRVVDVVKGPLETKIIQEIKPPPPETLPPPPKLSAPPPPFIPPPEVNIAEPAAAQNSITTVTTVKPVETPPPVMTAKAAVHVPPVVKASGCREPEYPAASARLGETGRVVLGLLVGVDGKVTDSRIETSSGHPRLDEAAREALSLCKFKPGTVDDQPEQAWAKIAYVFKSPD